jgi:hypothetical protein
VKCPEDKGKLLRNAVKIEAISFFEIPLNTEAVYCPELP